MGQVTGSLRQENKLSVPARCGPTEVMTLYAEQASEGC